MSDQQQPVFGIEKIYVKDLSLEIPNAPRIFLEREAPEVNIHLHTKGERIDEGMYEVLLTITVTEKVTDKTMFLVEVRQSTEERREGHGGVRQGRYRGWPD